MAITLEQEIIFFRDIVTVPCGYRSWGAKSGCAEIQLVEVPVNIFKVLPSRTGLYEVKEEYWNKELWNSCFISENGFIYRSREDFAKNCDD